MKIAILSDIHDNIPYLSKALNWCRDNNVEEMICCGDVTNRDTLEYLAKEYGKPAYFIRGNMEIYDDEEIKEYANFSYLGRYNIITIENKKIGICHEPDFIDKILEKEKCDIVFYGHTHKPWEEKKGNTRVINPGTVAGTFSRPTFACWDTETNEVELVMIEKL